MQSLLAYTDLKVAGLQSSPKLKKVTGHSVLSPASFCRTKQCFAGPKQVYDFSTNPDICYIINYDFFSICDVGLHTPIAEFWETIAFCVRSQDFEMPARLSACAYDDCTTTICDEQFNLQNKHNFLIWTASRLHASQYLTNL